MRGLYAIVDVGSLQARGLAVEPFARAVLAARPAALQLRDKTSAPAHTLAHLQTLAPHCRDAGVMLFANDRPDLALLAGAGGVHLGQDDVPPRVARSLGAEVDRSLVVGMSAHDEAEVDRALGCEPDYIALGPVFGTGSKARPAPTLGLEGLSALALRVRRARATLPIVAIGGIGGAALPLLRDHCDAVALIAALLPESAVDPYREVTERTHALVAAWGVAAGGAPS
jgi:thiamine-phosphate pyrophosphorylase